MKIVFTSNYSQHNIDVYNLSLDNHVTYCQKHGYDLSTYKEPYSPHLDVARLRGFFGQGYDAIVNIGTDVIIQKMDIPITEYMTSAVGFMMCREITNGNSLNGDFIIMMKSEESNTILNVLNEKQKRYTSAQDCLNFNELPVHVSPYLQIAAPNMNPNIDYSKFNLDGYFSKHYHSIGKAPVVMGKVRGMKADLNQK